jgi:hypothetical protein
VFSVKGETMMWRRFSHFGHRLKLQEYVNGLEVTPASSERAYDLFLHEDEMYYQRASFFWVAESMVLVAFSLISNHRSGILAQGRIIAIFGLVLTIAYGYAIHRAVVYYLPKRAGKEKHVRLRLYTGKTTSL